MSITVDSLRNLSSFQKVVVDVNRKSLERADRNHRIASFFGDANAKAVNRQTYEAIKKAVLSDTRYFGVQERARELLSRIDPEKAIRAGTIKRMVRQLDRLSTPQHQQAQLVERFTAHLAMRQLPQGWEADKLQAFFKKNVGQIIAATGGAEKVNVSLALARICSSLQTLSDAMGGNPRLFEAARESVLTHSTNIASLEAGCQQLKAVMDELVQRDAAVPNIRIFDRAAQQISRMDRVITPDDLTDIRRAAQFASQITPANWTVVHRATQQMEAGMGALLERDSAKGIAADAHQLLSKCLDLGTRIAAFTGEQNQAHALTFATEELVASLTHDNQSTLLAQLKTADVQNLVAFYSNGEVTTQEPSPHLLAFHTLVQTLQASLGVEDVPMVILPGKCDMDSIPLSAMSYYPVMTMFTGSVGLEDNEDVQTRLQLLRNLQTPTQSVDSVVRTHRREMEANLSKGLVATELKRHLTGDGGLFRSDISRNMVMILPNGQRLADIYVSDEPINMSNHEEIKQKKFIAARDALTQYVSGNPEATYQAADPVIQKKTNLLMSLLSQDTIKLADTVAPIMPFDGKLAPGMLSPAHNQGTSALVISETPDGGWCVTATTERPINMISFPMPQKDVWCEDGSHFRAEAQVSVSGAEIERVSQLEDAVILAEQSDVQLQVDAAVTYKLILK